MSTRLSIAVLSSAWSGVKDDGRGGARGWGDRLDAATAAAAETAHSLLRIAKGGAPASSTAKPNAPTSVGHPPTVPIGVVTGADSGLVMGINWPVSVMALHPGRPHPPVTSELE